MRLVPWIPPLFHDREAAGQVLAEALTRLPLHEPIVVGVARGGVAVAVEVARALGAPLTAVDVERVNVPDAVSEPSPRTARVPSPTDDVPETVVAAASSGRDARAELLEQRLELETLPVAGRTTVLVDDGLITGLTLAAACRWARAEQAARVVGATPVGQVAGLDRLRGEADEVVCPHALEEIAVVGQAYDSFDPLDEWYVAGLLRDYAAGG